MYKLKYCIRLHFHSSLRAAALKLLFSCYWCCSFILIYYHIKTRLYSVPLSCLHSLLRKIMICEWNTSCSAGWEVWPWGVNGTTQSWLFFFVFFLNLMASRFFNCWLIVVHTNWRADFWFFVIMLYFETKKIINHKFLKFIFLWSEEREFSWKKFVHWGRVIELSTRTSPCINHHLKRSRGKEKRWGEYFLNV